MSVPPSNSVQTKVHAKPLRRIRRYALFSLTLAGLSFLGACWLVGGALVAPAKHIVRIPTTNLPIQTRQLPKEDGDFCAAWHIPCDYSVVTVILAHPLRGNRRSMFPRAELFHQLGYSVLLIDLQAHGETAGENITFGYLERHDIHAAVRFVRREHPEEQVVVLGRSLGGAAALLAAPLDIDALILESVYPTIEEATQNRLHRRMGWLARPVRPLLLAQLPVRLGISATELHPIDGFEKLNCPVLIMSGAMDEHTTREETQRMYAEARAPKKLVLFPNANHEDLQRHDPPFYESCIAAFLEQHLPKSAQ